MRFLIHEMPYESLLRAGIFRYERNGQPTGAVEHWRLTAAPDGYRILRVDLDARDAPSGHSSLYHATLAPDGHPLQLKVRFWSGAWTMVGTVLREDPGWTAGRTVNGLRFEDVVAGQAAFWFPACAGLGLLAARVVAAEQLPAVTLRPVSTDDSSADPKDIFALQAEALQLQWGPEENMVVAGQERLVRPLSITWSDQERTLWLDNSNWPLRVVRQDGLAAVETRDIRWPIGD